MFDDCDAVGFQLPAHHIDQFRIVLRHDGKHFQHRHPAAQMPMCLGQLNADGATADNDQVCRQGGGGKGGFIGEKIHIF